jgi:FAD/FMN-containing dehydrogenase
MILPAARERVWGWGRAVSAESWVARPTAVAQIADVFAAARARRLTVGPRGAGQSYGDASLNDGAISLDLTALDRILAWDPATGVVRAEPGASIRALWRATLADGWWPPVVSGTMRTTLGGGVAMNIHGKNNWKVGPIGDHVRAFDLLLPDGTLRRCSRTEDPELFHAAIGGFGMLGVITAVELQLKRVHSGLLDVEAFPVPNLDAMLRVFEEHLATADYLVGWVDVFASGSALGRGLVHRARYLAPGEDPDPAATLRLDAQELPARLFGVLPRGIVWRLLRPFATALGMRLVNRTKVLVDRLRGRHGYRQSHAAFHFLLDWVPDFERAYGPAGLIQYQSFVPAAAGRHVFAAQLDLARRRGIRPFIGVVKRHRADAFLMTHAVDGWSLALDFPASDRAGLWALAAEMDRVVLDAGGRFYFAKDLTLAPERLRRYLAEERVARFRALKQACDPEGLLSTNLWRRLFAAPDAASGRAPRP